MSFLIVCLFFHASLPWTSSYAILLNNTADVGPRQFVNCEFNPNPQDRSQHAKTKEIVIRNKNDKKYCCQKTNCFVHTDPRTGAKNCKLWDADIYREQFNGQMQLKNVNDRACTGIATTIQAVKNAIDAEAQQKLAEERAAIKAAEDRANALRLAAEEEQRRVTALREQAELEAANLARIEAEKQQYQIEQKEMASAHLKDGVSYNAHVEVATDCDGGYGETYEGPPARQEIVEIWMNNLAVDKSKQRQGCVTAGYDVIMMEIIPAECPTCIDLDRTYPPRICGINNDLCGKYWVDDLKLMIGKRVDKLFQHVKVHENQVLEAIKTRSGDTWRLVRDTWIWLNPQQNRYYTFAGLPDCGPGGGWPSNEPPCKK